MRCQPIFAQPAHNNDRQRKGGYLKEKCEATGNAQSQNSQDSCCVGNERKAWVRYGLNRPDW